MSDKLLTVKDVAERLSVSVKTVHSLINEGEIAFIEIGSGKLRRTIRVDEGDLQDYIKRNRRRPIPTPLATTHRSKAPATTDVIGFLERREQMKDERAEKRKKS